MAKWMYYVSHFYCNSRKLVTHTERQTSLQQPLPPPLPPPPPAPLTQYVMLDEVCTYYIYYNSKIIIYFSDYFYCFSFVCLDFRMGGTAWPGNSECRH